MASWHPDSRTPSVVRRYYFSNRIVGGSWASTEYLKFPVSREQTSAKCKGTVSYCSMLNSEWHLGKLPGPKEPWMQTPAHLQSGGTSEPCVGKPYFRSFQIVLGFCIRPAALKTFVPTLCSVRWWYTVPAILGSVRLQTCSDVEMTLGVQYLYWIVNML